MANSDALDLSNSSALVADSNPTSRSILADQLRSFGISSVTQVARATDARNQLEYKAFDIVLCELNFSNDTTTGQELVDDLRRNQLLPFSTVFIMVTGEASYANVAEAAESALDSYLLKPHKASQLGERIMMARVRKLAMQTIYTAMEAGDFGEAAELCLQRFNSRADFWIYAARLGAELLLRLGRNEEARSLFDAVIEAKALPWARLGVARALLDSGQTATALSTLENLISQEPGFSDAYDVMGRAQFELGRFDAALATYKIAAQLTPHSISRQQNVGMMAFYAGDRGEAEKILERTCLLGMNSKMFDCQSLVLMAFSRLERNDSRGLQRCVADFDRIRERFPDDKRIGRLYEVVAILTLIQHHKIAQALSSIREMASQISDPLFDFESATNMVAMLAQLAKKSIQLPEVAEDIEKLATRFCATRAMTEVLAGSAAAHPEYVEIVRAAYKKVTTFAENAMKLSLQGNPAATVEALIRYGCDTMNIKFVESASMVLDRYRDSISTHDQLQIQIQAARERSKSGSSLTLGEQKRQSGGLSLRVTVPTKRALTQPEVR